MKKTTGYYTHVVTKSYPEELIVTRYYANSLLRFTNGLEMYDSSTNVHLG